MRKKILILASNCEVKPEALKILNVPFRQVKVKVDEKKIKGKNIKTWAERLAVEKAKSIAEGRINSIILTSAGVVKVESKILGSKPRFKMDAVKWLMKMSGRTHTMQVGWAIINADTKKKYFGSVKVEVNFRTLTGKEVTDYVNDYNVVGWAGGYSTFNNKAVEWVKWIKGSINGFVYRMPMEKILPVIKQEM